MRVLLTNDDGLQATGLQTLRSALLEVPGVELVTIAPDGNRSAVGRGITTRRPLWATEFVYEDGTRAFATDGTPVDCVRFASLGLAGGHQPELVVSGINHGSNLGDDVTYSGTVAAAFEGIVLGIPAIAVSQQSDARELDFRLGNTFDFSHAARFVARLVEEIESVPLPEGTLLNLNFPAGAPEGVEVTQLGKRVYRDELVLESEDPDDAARKRYWIYNERPHFEDQVGTDIAAVARGRVAVTPLHFDLTHHDGLGPLTEFDLQRLVEPAAQELE